MLRRQEGEANRGSDRDVQRRRRIVEVLVLRADLLAALLELRQHGLLFALLLALVDDAIDHLPKLHGGLLGGGLLLRRCARSWSAELKHPFEQLLFLGLELGDLPPPTTVIALVGARLRLLALDRLFLCFVAGGRWLFDFSRGCRLLVRWDLLRGDLL